MEVRVSISGQIVVDGQVDTLDIDTTSENVGGDTDTLVEILELLVAFDTVALVSRISKCPKEKNLPLLLAHTGVDGDTGEVALAQQFIQLIGADSALDENDDLVELEAI